MLEWFHGLAGSDRRALLVGAAALLAALLWFLLLAPLHAALAEAALRHAAVIQAHQRMLSLQRDAHQLGGMARNASAPLMTRVREVIERSPEPAAVSLQQRGVRSVEIRTETLLYSDLIRMLIAFENAGLITVWAEMHATDARLVTARVKLQLP